MQTFLFSSNESAVKQHFYRIGYMKEASIRNKTLKNAKSRNNSREEAEELSPTLSLRTLNKLIFTFTI